MIDRLYHVTGIDDLSGGLLSLRDQLGEEDAIREYQTRWPDAGPALAAAHCWMIHCYADVDSALDHAAVWGGRVVEIDATGLYVRIDRAEDNLAHPVLVDAVLTARLRFIT